MPDGEKLPRCPKGERRGKKTKQCVKKSTPKHKAVKENNNNTRKKPVPKKKANSKASEKRNTRK
jgi:hypothetical protein